METMKTEPFPITLTELFSIVEVIAYFAVNDFVLKSNHRFVLWNIIKKKYIYNNINKKRIYCTCNTVKRH